MKKILIIIGLVILILGVVLLLNRSGANQTITPANPTPSPTNVVKPTNSTSANPASENCVKVGGVVEIEKNGNGDEYGLCAFEDNMKCEEWALFRGDCPVGGRKTTGYDTIAQKYCAWLGGKTFAEENATCTLPNGKVCKDEDLYNGSCAAQ